MTDLSKPTAEQLIESWMLKIVTGGGVDRFGDLHIDQIDERWKHRKVWVSGGIEAYRIALALRNQHHLPFVVARGFSLKTRAGGVQGSEFHTRADFADGLDWSPPSLYLFHPDKTPGRTAQVPCEPYSQADSITVQDLSTGLLSTEAKRTYRLTFKCAGSEQYSDSVFVEG